MVANLHGSPADNSVDQAAAWLDVTSIQEKSSSLVDPDSVRIADPKSRGKVILGVAESDAHVVANRLIAILLRDHGYEVLNLGACTPVSEFMEAYQLNPDSIAIVIGSLNGHAVQDLESLASSKRDYQVRCPIFLGGNLSVGAREETNLDVRFSALGVDRVVSDPESLIALLNDIAILSTECAA